MKNTILSLLIAFSTSILFSQENERVIGSYFEFELGKTERMYGDKVILRSKPSSNSDAIDTLKIAQEVKLLAKSDEKMSVNGIESNWYKVKVKNNVGYLAGGLIAQDNKEINGKKYLVTTAFHDERLFARVRVVNQDKKYYGHEIDLPTSAFGIKVYDNRGLEGIQDMLVIDLFAEACGVDGGEIYLFNDGIKLFEALHLSSIGDGGIFWFDESVVFPGDEEGQLGVVMYTREHGEVYDEELGWYKTVIHSLPLKWENAVFAPNIETFDFDQEPQFD